MPGWWCSGRWAGCPTDLTYANLEVPLAAGVLMKLFGPQSLYAFFTFFALVLVWRIRPKAVTNLHQVDDAPLHHVAMPDSMSSSPLVAALDPRVDEQVVQG